MLRLVTALLLFVGVSAQATTFSYDFDGDFSASFTRVNAEDDRYFFDQEDGELPYFVNDGSTSGVTDSENNLAYIVDAFSPRYDQSWEASVDVTMPLVYFEQNLISQYLEAGLVAGHAPFGLESPVGARFFEAGLRMDSSGGTSPLERVLRGSVGDADSIVDFSSVDATEETIRIGLRFNSETKVLSALSDDVVFYSRPLDEAVPIDWNMDDSDTFLVVLFAGSELEPITPDDAVTFDNFRAMIIPEPSAALLVVAAAVARLQRR